MSSVTGPNVTDLMPASHNADLALARLLRLASPILPVGAFSYSQGLEPAAERGLVRDEATAQRWIGDVLAHSVATFEAPIWSRLYRAWEAGDAKAAADWNQVFLAGRESAEFRAETLQMGYSLRTLLIDSAEFDDMRLTLLREVEDAAFPTAFSFACAAWQIAERQGLLGYLWAWLENQVSAAMKTVPLGQLSGQRILATLSAALPGLVAAALRMEDDELSNCAPGLAIASSRHETQYSRLFRS
jgi:urease accessory protein